MVTVKPTQEDFFLFYSTDSFISKYPFGLTPY